MKRIAVLAVLVVSGTLLFAAPAAVALSAIGGVEPDVVVRKRAPARLRVRPIYPRQPFHSLYPPPYDVRYPGPNAKRECVARYVEEHRPSGTVVTPRMRCWWVRG